MKTIRNFKNFCGETLAALVTPVKNQLGADTVADFWAELENVNASPYGAAAGFTGFIHYPETAAFWRAYRSEITALMKEEAEMLGESSMLNMVLGFNGLKGYEEDEIARALYGDFDDDFTQIYNVFAWFALEEVAYRYADFSYECK